MKANITCHNIVLERNGFFFVIVFLRFYNFILCRWIFGLLVSLCTLFVPGTCGIQKGASNSLLLEIVVSCPVGTENHESYAVEN